MGHQRLSDGGNTARDDEEALEKDDVIEALEEDDCKEAHEEDYHVEALEEGGELLPDDTTVVFSWQTSQMLLALITSLSCFTICYRKWVE